MEQLGLRLRLDPGVTAVAAFSVAIAVQNPIWSTVFALFGLVFVASLLRRGTVAVGAKDLFRFAGFGGLLVLLVRMRITESPSPFVVAYVLLIVSCLATGAWFGVQRYGRLVSIGLGLLSVVLGTLTVTLDWWQADAGADVYLAHVGAGSVLAESENPYTSAVRVPDSSPYRELGRIIEGYNYPPVILMSYGLAATLTDPRVISIVAWLFVVGWAAKRALGPEPRSDPAFAIFLLLATMATWPMVLFVGWSEPLSAALFLAAGILWERRWQAGPVALALALGSKQYFIVLAPLLLAQTAWKRGRRWGVLGLAAATVLAGAAAFGAENLYRKLVADLLEIPFRPDTLSLPGLLYGLGVPAALPRTAALIIALVVAVALAKSTSGYPEFLIRGALILGVVFMAGVGLPNYWLIVLLMVAIGRVAMTTAGPGVPGLRGQEAA